MYRATGLMRQPKAFTGLARLARFYSEIPAEGSYERLVYDKLAAKLAPQELVVKDVSGGCGSMFAIKVVSGEFKGIPMVKQHRLVNEILADEISKWHGLQLRTQAPK